MERDNTVKEKLIVPTDFISSAHLTNVQRDLIPPSHFTSTAQSSGAQRGVQSAKTLRQTVWKNLVPTSEPRDPNPASPWFTFPQGKLKENQGMLLLPGDFPSANETVGQPAAHRFAEKGEQKSIWESQYQLGIEKHKAETERLKGQVQALKEAAEKYREELKNKEIALCRCTHELEVARENASKAKAEISQVREKLSLSRGQEEMMRSQLEKVRAECGEEIAQLRRSVEKSKEESRELVLKAEMSWLQAEEEAKEQALRLSKQLEKMKEKQEAQLQHLNTSYCAELDAARKGNAELQDRLQSMSTQVLQLQSALMETSTERDELKEHLSHVGRAFETQSATLQSLRNYIGQLAPERGEKEQLKETVELNKEKAALQTTTELLTVRLNSLNEILALQEEKLVKKQTFADPLQWKDSQILQVLQLWREKVFKLCVQLRSKDIEMRREKDKLLIDVRSTEQQLQQEQHQNRVLQHSLQDRMAELDLERVEKERLKEDLTKVERENAELKSQSQRAEAEMKTLIEAVHRFKKDFESNAAEVDSAKAQLNTFTQRLSFAARRVETIQCLVMRRAALQKIEQACQQPKQEENSLINLQTEYNLICEERDRLTLELKRTPELMEKALADLQEQHGSEVRQLQQELEQSCGEVKRAVAGKEKAEQSLQQIQAQLDENNVSLETLRCELLRLQERNQQALQERVSEIQAAHAEKMRELELQLHAARREHTKAVMTLRQFQRQENTNQNVLNKHLKEMEGSKKFLHVTMAEHAEPASRRGEILSEKRTGVEAEAHQPAERLLCVLEELHTLSAVVVNSSEDSSEEELQSDDRRTSADLLYSQDMKN
ncbi:coiled-coil alpha-helical rod protein 1 isoform X2 [Oryzias melastigma]|uniref:coiled-coil alpha-helical rod protein 1 isoform X2 n=1 Tax=Oryzias melastigma TaxID=30732 RepID=UPI000CF8040C|nr:coiled-coil alpha-helical rod protein 1 isoform X2 [Oryzias melastigma]